MLWPDFSKIPLSSGKGMTVEWLPMKPERVYEVAGYKARAVLVSHTIESAAFIVERGDDAIAYSGDTGPTARLWELLSETPTLRAILMEVSFPDHQQALARVSGHHTPATLNLEMDKLKGPHNPRELPVLLYHIKPFYQREVERELARIKRRALEVLALGDEFLL